jgi:hypothetical protein
MVTKCSAFWDTTPYSLESHLTCFHLQGQRISEARNQQEAELPMYSATLVDFHCTIQRYIQKIELLRSKRIRENLKGKCHLKDRRRWETNIKIINRGTLFEGCELVSYGSGQGTNVVKLL